MRQRFPRRARPLVAAAAVTFATFGIAAASHVARQWSDLYGRFAILQALQGTDQEKQDAVRMLRKLGPRAVPALAARAREGPIPDELFEVLAAGAGEAEIDVLAGSVVGMEVPRRKAALEALARIHTGEAAKRAGPALADPAPEVRNAAREVLWGQDESVVSASVREAMGLASFYPEFVARLLGGPDQAVEPVAEGLRSHEPTRIYNAIRLAQSAFSASPPSLDREALLAAGISDALDSRVDVQSTQSLAVELLASLRGPEARAALCAAAGSRRLPDPVRVRAIEVLAGRREPPVVATLEALVRLAKGDLRSSAAKALGRSGSEKDADRWLDMVERHVLEREAEEALLPAISEAGSVSLVPRMLVLARTSELQGVRSSVEALLSRDPAGSIPALLDEIVGAEISSLYWLNDQLRKLTSHQRPLGAWRTVDEFKRERAALHKEWTLWWNLNKERTSEDWRAGALRETQDALRSTVSSERASAVERLTKLAPDDLETQLSPLLDDADALVWSKLQSAFTSRPTAAGGEILRGKVTAGTAREQWRAAQLLGTRRESGSVDVLVAALGEKDTAIRRESAAALGKLGEPRAAIPLAPLLRDTENDVRDAARDSLDALGNRAIEPQLLEGLKSPDDGYRLSCATLLGRCGTKKAIRPLVAFFHDRNQVLQQAALRSFQQLSGLIPATLDPAEQDLRGWELDVERRQR